MVVLIGVVAFIIGLIGFIQIQRISKRDGSFTAGAVAWIVALIVIWILSGVLFDGTAMIAFYVGYQLAFILSFVFAKN